jgi:hypothetical protein
MSCIAQPLSTHSSIVALGSIDVYFVGLNERRQQYEILQEYPQALNCNFV